jgi:Na+/proline symporter/signal transduction histidine kinase/ActR/RegA family two-component response regulator
VQKWLVVTMALAYVGLLFAIAWHGDRRAARPPGGKRRRTPLLYALSLGVYCSSWTFYGSVGSASTAGFDFLPIYVGPILVIGLGWPLLAKMVLVAKEQNTVSIADFIASRYGKSQAVAALVTIVAVIGVTPYIGLQLKAVASSYDALTGGVAQAASFWSSTALFVTGFMAAFAILFGVRDITASEHHPGMMTAIAFESVVKLVAFLVVGAVITFALSPGIGAMLAHAATDPALGHLFHLDLGRPVWWSMTLLSGLAILCLPRQFHAAVVENTDVADVPAAAWMFPLYLVAINVFVLPVAMTGLIYFGNHGPDADTFMVSLPVALGASGLGLLAFIGGLSAATAMVIVSTVALSTMLCNDVVMPLLLKLSSHFGRRPSDQVRLLLGTRRAAVVAILLLANGHNVVVGAAYPLASIGLVSFVAVAQFGPAMLGGLFWRRGNHIGALAGIGIGFALWAYTLFLPSFVEGGFLAPGLLTEGPWGIFWLRPQALFGLGGLDPLSHAVIWTLGANILLYVTGSLATEATGIERRQAAAFIEAVPHVSYSSAIPLKSQTTIDDLRMLAETYLGAERAAEAFRHYLGQPRLSPDGLKATPLARANLGTVRFTERLLAGAIGAASARVVVAGSLQRKMLSRVDVMAVLDDASQAIRFNHELLRATLENVSQGICVFDSALRLASWNQRFLELNELTAETVRVGTSLAELAAFGSGSEAGINDQMQTLLERRRAAGHAGEPDVYERRRPDGDVLEIATNPMPDGGFVATFTEVTERHNAATALREANESLERRVAERTTALSAAKAEAEQANLSKTRFLASASHDLLQPLHAARLFTSALADRRQDGLVAKVDASLRSVETLLGALLDVSKLDGGAVRPELSAFPIDTVLTALDEEFTVIARERGIGFRMVTSRLGVRSDPALLRRILQNFLANAMRYTVQGRVLVGCRRRGAALRIDVWDTGPGIPEESFADIFQEFHRLEPKPETGQGLGLGLAIVDRIARMLDHPVTVRSRLGRGSCFSVTVPIAALTPEAAAAPLPRRRRGFGGALVLCIDNDATILEGMEALLGGWQCEVIGAAGVDAALSRLSGRTPDAAIIDYRLDEGVTGLVAIDQLFAQFGRAIPCVVITADHTDAVRQAVEGRGCQILYKPVRPAALRALLGGLVPPVRRPSAAPTMAHRRAARLRR